MTVVYECIFIKCVHACMITNAACDEHQFLVNIKYDENINSPAWVKCWNILEIIGCIPNIIIFCKINEVNDHMKNNGQTIRHRI